jgi:hypothetical protein
MSHDTKTVPTSVLQTPARGRTNEVRKLQFSLSALMLVMACVGIACATIRWLGFVWLVPLSLAGLSAVSLALAVRSRSDWRMLKLGYWHCTVWLGLGAAASAMAVSGCLNYNTIAGTDKTPGHIVQISAAVLAGPLVGPIANEGAGEAPQARRWTAILFTVLVVAAGPFLFVRTSILWFFGAMISLGVFLS